ncbi:hypothetical protein [Vibrio gallicus]|uniref:hypothetical protein n=1 Tax=Vibrio gallicus TaxID=190897 RepID=UPI0021C3EFA0|nr:hypothetical protein [Vibrio gallicus]
MDYENKLFSPVKDKYSGWKESLKNNEYLTESDLVEYAQILEVMAAICIDHFEYESDLEERERFIKMLKNMKKYSREHTLNIFTVLTAHCYD